VILGFALGGFFDGILLHQILQWHHLLSLVRGVDTLREQVLWDGYFHALMYVVAAMGLWGLWRVRRQADERWGRALAGALLVGFGLWHITDSILSHWLLGIHRIKPDSPDPLTWDLVWFTIFGLLPSFAGWMIVRRPRHGTGRPGASLMVMAAGLLTTGLAVWSLQPSQDQQFTTIVFAPWVRPAEAINAVVANDGRLLWTDQDLAVMVVDVPPENRLQFYGQGALLISGSGLPNGCFNWLVASDR
jgi:uncharacterized membrane protein